MAEPTSHHHQGGRRAVRRMTVSAALAAYRDWPGVGLVGEEPCSVTDRGQTTTHPRTVLTSLPVSTPAAAVRRFVRGPWRREHRLPDIRDLTMGEDRGRWRAGAGDSRPEQRRRPTHPRPPARRAAPARLARAGITERP